MSSETIVAVYDNMAHADAAVQSLHAIGIADSAIQVHSDMTTTTGTMKPVREEGFWASLFGGEPDHDSAFYDRSLENGGSVVTVTVDEAHAAQVSSILESHAPIDIDAGATHSTATHSTATHPTMATGSYATGATGMGTTGLGTTGMGTTTDAHGNTMSLSEEQLTVGKRLVNRGGTRIRRFVIETPVEESVTLHDERVTLERRPVTGEVVGNPDFTDKVIEMTETSEEAVVAKKAFVREQITLHRDETDRVETVRDTVRREDVEIEKIPGETVQR